MPTIDLNDATLGEGCSYPAPYDEPVKSRSWLRLGDAAGLTQFGVNLLTVPPGGWSGQRHWHDKEDEFLLVLSGEIVLVTDAGEETLHPGDCAGFPADSGDGHHLQNRTEGDARILVVGTRNPKDVVTYSDIDMMFGRTDKRYTRKDGSEI